MSTMVVPEPERQILVNLEINRDCHLTKVCGDQCILNRHEHSLLGAEVMDPAEVLQAACEVIDHGYHVRHLALVGKEVLESPEVLFAILQHYHLTPVVIRPASIQIITSGILLHRHTEQFAKWPLSACQLSLDVSSTGLHVPRDNAQLLADLLQLRRQGGAALIGVISVLSDSNLEEVIALGKHLCFPSDRQGSAINQWAVGQLLVPVQEAFVPAVSFTTVEQAWQRIIREFGQAPDTRILFELELPDFQKLLGRTVPKNAWRTECNVPKTNVWGIALSMEPGHFVRLRWDGQLLAKEDVRRLGVHEGKYGRYRPGKLRDLLESWS